MNAMYAIEPEIKVWLEFPSMPAPVEVAVPWNVLHYLDTHGLRRVDPDGAVVYSNPLCARRQGASMHATTRRYALAS